MVTPCGGFRVWKKSLKSFRCVLSFRSAGGVKHKSGLEGPPRHDQLLSGAFRTCALVQDDRRQEWLSRALDATHPGVVARLARSAGSQPEIAKVCLASAVVSAHCEWTVAEYLGDPFCKYVFVTAATLTAEHTLGHRASKHDRAGLFRQTLLGGCNVTRLDRQATVQGRSRQWVSRKGAGRSSRN